MRQDTAAQEGAELLLDEAGDRLIAVRSARQEAFQLRAHDLVEERLLGLSPSLPIATRRWGVALGCQRALWRGLRRPLNLGRSTAPSAPGRHRRSGP